MSMFENVFKKLVIRSACCNSADVSDDDEELDHVKSRLRRLEVDIKRCIKDQKHILGELESLIKDVKGVGAAHDRERLESASSSSSPRRMERTGREPQ